MAISETQKELDSSKSQLAALETKDVLADQITAIFEGRVGDPLPADVMDLLPTEGEDRYKRGIPPGFEDRKKPDTRRFGDLILWKQILAFALTNKAPLLFITDDAKEDWWWKNSGKNIGPLPLLKHELQAISGQPFHMYRPDRFLHFASQHLKKPIKKETITEVKESLQEQAARARQLRDEDHRFLQLAEARDRNLAGAAEARRRDLEERFRPSREVEDQIRDMESRGVGNWRNECVSHATWRIRFSRHGSPPSGDGGTNASVARSRSIGSEQWRRFNLRPSSQPLKKPAAATTPVSMLNQTTRKRLN